MMERYATLPKGFDDIRMKKVNEATSYSYSSLSSCSPYSLFLSQSNSRKMVLCLVLGVLFGITGANVYFSAVDKIATMTRTRTNEDYENNREFMLIAPKRKKDDEEGEQIERKENEEFLAAMRYFQCTQTDKEAEVKVVNLGTGGGLGSMLQFSWRELLKYKTDPQKHVAVRFAGNLKWYTANEGCKETPSYECFFLDPTSEGHIDVGDANMNNSDSIDRNVSPVLSCEERYAVGNLLPIKQNAFWWRITSAYLFSPKPNILSAAEAVREQFHFTDFPDVALHIRRGDKLHDGASRQTVPITLDMYFEVAEKLVIEAAASKSSQILVYIASDDKEAMMKARDWETQRGGMNDLNFKIIMQETKITELEGTQISESGNSLASDKKYAEALLFLVDLHFMMHSSYFAGLVMSQPARIVADIGFAKGSMLKAIALDEENIENGLADGGWKALCTGWHGKSEVLSQIRAHEGAKQDSTAPSDATTTATTTATAAAVDNINDDNEKPKLCWEKPDEKFCWNQGLTIEEHVDAQLYPWISKGGISPKDVESTHALRCDIVSTNGDSGNSYVSRALKAYPELRPETDICIHKTNGDWPESTLRDCLDNNFCPLSIVGSSYEAFLDIAIPYSYGNRDAFGDKYEEKHKNVLEIGTNSPEWSQKKNTAVWRGSVGCSVGCADKGELYFPSNHIQHCSDDHKAGSWDANKAGRTWGCDQSKAAVRHQRMQLANMSFHRGEECGLDAAITTWNEHEGTLREYSGMTSEELGNLKRAGYSEREQATYKYIVNVQNNGFADRLWRLLALKVVVLQEMHAFREFFYDMLIPWVHYVPIKTDLSDLCEKIQWLRDNDEKAREIAENAHEFVREQLSLDNINLYVASLIHRIGQLTVQGHNLTDDALSIPRKNR